MTRQSLLTSHPVLDLKRMHRTFQASGIDSQLQDNQLTLENSTLTTVITLVPVYGESLDSGPVAGLLRIRTEISQYMGESSDPDQLMDRINRTAVMGAVYRDEAGYTVGSRLTVRPGVRSESTFLPDELREAPRIAVTLSFWALNRSLWVSDVIEARDGEAAR